MINYSISLRANPSDQDAPKKAYANAQYSEIMTLDKFAEHISTHGSKYNRADIQAVLIRRALEKYRAQTIYLIIGLMLGSIFAVVMGPTTLDTPQPAMGIHDFSILFFLIGGAVILGLQKMKDIKQ